MTKDNDRLNLSLAMLDTFVVLMSSIKRLLDRYIEDAGEMSDTIEESLEEYDRMVSRWADEDEN